VRTGVLLGGAGEIGAAGQGHSAPPDDLLSADDRRLEDLVFEVAVEQRSRLDEGEDLSRLGEVAGEGLLTGEADELRAAAADAVDDLLDDLDTQVVRGRDPERIDGGIAGELGERAVDSRSPTRSVRARPARDSACSRVGL
jgi:hypothetical protein